MELQGFRFASFVLDASRHRLTGPGGEISLRPKSFEVLALLLARAGHLVTKEEILRAVWPDLVVTDDSLTRCISDVRLAVQDSDRTLIRTVVKLGYIIDIPVAVVDEPAGAAPVSPTSAKQVHDAMRGEGGSRQATAVYVDVHEEIEALSRNDPEAALSHYEAVIAQASQVFRDLGATTQLTPGEGIAGLFGVPAAQEDHAQRACQAALGCHAKLVAPNGAAAWPLARIGVASGRVVFRSLEGAPDPVWSALGPTVDQAKHLGRAAARGTTLISSSTRRLVEGRFMLVGTEPSAPGANQGACLLAGPLPRTSRFKAAMARGLTRFIGRESELAQLQQAQRLAAGGRGQVVALIGEAGVGKSRLVHELVQSLDRSLDWRVLDCAAVPYGKATSYLPVIELLQRNFGIESHDDVEGMQGKMQARVRVPDAGLQASLPALLALLELPVDDASWIALDPGQRRFRTLDAVVRLLRHEARVQPLLLLFEDLHWADAETQAVLDALVEGLAQTRLMLVLNYRPDFRHGWANKSGYTQIRLEALAPESGAQMLGALLGEGPALDGLKSLLVRRANPFFLEEAVRTLVDSGALAGEPSSYRLTRDIEAIRIPATVEAMLAARIDHLDSDDRRVLEVASVIGRVVPRALLLAVAGPREGALLDAIKRLQVSEFLYQGSGDDQSEYAFRHALIQEVTYGGLLQARRRELHASACHALESLHGDRIGEHTERLAHHARRGELGEKAVHYLRQAGLKAAARAALGDARLWFEQALEVQRGLPETPAMLEQGFEVRLELRGVLYQLGDPHAVLACLREAEAIAERLHDERRNVRVAAFITSVHTMLGQLDAAVAIGQRTLQPARQVGELELRINAANYLVQAHYYRGDYRHVLELAAESLADWPDHWVYRYHVGNPAPASVFNRAFMAMSLAQLGRFAEAATYETEAIDLAEPTQNAFALAVAHVSVPTLHTLRGDWVTALMRVERYIAAARTGNILSFLSTALAASAWILAESGEHDEALHRIEESRQLLDRQAAKGIGNLGGSYGSLGRACLALGRIDRARAYGKRALELSQSMPGVAAHAQQLLGDVSRKHDPGGTESETFYRKALALAEPRGMRPLEAQCHAGLAALYGSSVHRRSEAELHWRLSADIQRQLG